MAAAFGEAAAAPAIATGDIKTGHLQAADVQQWLTQVQGLDLANPSYQRGIAKLEQLLTALSRRDLPVPKETALLANYPNPFNPETWIPFRLASPEPNTLTDVTLSIYAADGKLVRTLALGQLPAGTYQSRSRAAYWDGRNAQGEPVASGVYFYTLEAGDFSATRKMVIRNRKPSPLTVGRGLVPRRAPVLGANVHGLRAADVFRFGGEIAGDRPPRYEKSRVSSRDLRSVRP